MSTHDAQSFFVRRITITAALLATIGISPLARAQSVEAPPPVSSEESATADEGSFDVSLTFSPLHLLIVVPVLELTAEVRADRDVGVAIIGGYGSTGSWNVYELGGQLRYYATGSFDQGFELGAEVLFLGVRSSEGTGLSNAVSASGLAVGPFIGYKLTTRGGFTFDVQGGFQYLAPVGVDSERDRSELSAVIPLLNLNVGWSF